MGQLEYIKGVTFAPFAVKGSFKKKTAFESMRELKNRLNANFIIFVPNGLQETAQSEEICYTSVATMTDEELKEMIGFAKELGMRTAIKPIANCKNGTWRAHINFFDEEVHCEPKWSNWFRSYTDFQLHYAKIAEQMQCEMFIAGCEMVMSERREEEWRKLIADIKCVYSGLVSYNTDKYQEHHVKWWDAVDVISSSGYYPMGDWEKELDRIEDVVSKFQKPFFFAETGCMSVAGSPAVPNDWSIKGKVDVKAQADWYEDMIAAISKRDWVSGFALWDWPWKQYSLSSALRQDGYNVYGKPAETVISQFFNRGIK